jgi:hypothetical protein
MIEAHEAFWTEWAETYRSFSETIEPYRDAQRDLARAAVAALGDGAMREALTVMDVGGGAGNIIRPLLDALAARRGHLKKVTYILTDHTEAMAQLSNKRLEILRQYYPDVAFHILFIDTLDANFTGSVGENIGDIVINSWNVEYYSSITRQEIINQLVGLTSQDGVVAFSSMVQLPEDVTVRKVLMPLGQAQVLHSLLAGGLAEMKKTIASLRKITEFGIAINSADFPEKPTLTELRAMAKKAGLTSVWSEYHLYGASAMIVGRKDDIELTTHLPPQPAIAQALVGKEGYAGYPETVTFQSYLRELRKRTA